MDLENYELISNMLKRIKDKIKQFELEKDSKNLAFVKELKNELLEIIMRDREVYIAKTKINDSDNEIYNYRLVVEETLLDDNAEPIFIEIDLETGEIGLLGDGGFATKSKKINDKIVKSNFEIKSLMPILDAIKRYFSDLDDSYEKIDFRILKYIRNNPKSYISKNRTK